MVIYNSFINQLRELLGSASVVDGKCAIPDGTKNDILFAKDTAYELGGSQLPCVSTLAVSSDISFSNKVYLLGNDLSQIKKDTPFAKVVLVQIDDSDNDDEMFNLIKELEQVRYKFYVKDFMIRASALNMREQIRVGKNAIKQGISFGDYGQKLIDRYLQNEKVKSVDVYFVTEFDDFKALNSIAEKIKESTSALNHILDNILFDCSSCNLKPICDEVEGMKELHQKVMKK